MVPNPIEATDATPPGWQIEQIAGALRGLQFGEVTVIVQDGVVIQIDRLERRRLRKRREASSSRKDND